MEKNMKVDKKEELCRLLKKIERIPCVLPRKKRKKGFFNDLRRVEAIDEEIRGSGSAYKWIKGKNYYRLYGQADLETLKKEFSQGEFSKIVLVSSHADNKQENSSYHMMPDAEYINGCFDNASTNAVCTYIMKHEKNLPRNVLFAFTAGEEYNMAGAKHVSKKLVKHFGKGNINVVVLDVTYGFQGGVDFTFENDYFFKKHDGESFIKGIFDIANESDYTWNFLRSEKESDKKHYYVNSGEIRSYMGDGCLKYTDVEGDDETSEYEENEFNTFSLCLPCSAEGDTQMHLEDGFQISIQTICNYTDFLCQILKSSK